VQEKYRSNSNLVMSLRNMAKICRFERLWDQLRSVAESGVYERIGARPRAVEEYRKNRRLQAQQQANKNAEPKTEEAKKLIRSRIS